MVNRIVLAAVVGIAVTLACILVGSLLTTINVGLAVAVGAFLRDFSGVLGVLATLYYYFAGRALL